MENKKPKLGDVVEVPLPDGRLAYVQYVNHHREPPRYGALIRVLPGIFEHRPHDFSELVEKAERFLALFPLSAACNKGFARVVAHHPVPDHCKSWPLFKAYNENIETGERTWWTWDGVRSRRIGKLPREYFDLPMEETVDLKILRDRILSGWLPRDEVVR